jgi:hypothetical protein
MVQEEKRKHLKSTKIKEIPSHITCEEIYSIEREEMFS